MKRLAALRAELRQRCQHRAFRIPPAPAPDAYLERLLAFADPEPATVFQKQLDDKLLAEAATQLWRAQRRLARDGGPANARDRQTGRYLVACRDVLTEAGLEIQDHDGDTFHPGRSLEVLTFAEDSALTSEVVLETVRPTVYLLGRRVQMGQVIVAGPPAFSARTSEE
jgi:hypothetical protein